MTEVYVILRVRSVRRLDGILHALDEYAKKALEQERVEMEIAAVEQIGHYERRCFKSES